MNDVLTGSGLADAEELYSREAHRKRALEMYHRTSQQIAATTNPAATTSPAAISPENSYSATATQQTGMVSPENSSIAPPTGTAMDRSQSGHDSRFSLIMETFQVFQPTMPEVKQKEPKEPPNEVKVGSKIAVSGNYIPPPPERLRFARRSGKFHPSSASVNLERILREETAQEGLAPPLRILKHGEGTASNF